MVWPFSIRDKYGRSRPVRFSMAPCDNFFASRRARRCLPISMGVSFLSFYVLPFDVKVDPGRSPVLGDLLAVKYHLEFGDPRPLHPTDGFCGLCHGVFCGLRK